MTKTAFSSTFSRLLADRGRSAAWMASGAMLALGGWCWWAARAKVTLFEVSTAARVEIDAATYPIQSPLLGGSSKSNFASASSYPLPLSARLGHRAPLSAHAEGRWVYTIPI